MKFYTTIEKEIHYTYELPLRNHSIDAPLTTVQIRCKVEDEQDIRFVVRYSQGILARTLLLKICSNTYYYSSKMLHLKDKYDLINSTECTEIKGLLLLLVYYAFQMSFKCLLNAFQINVGDVFSVFSILSFRSQIIKYIGNAGS